MWQSAASPGHAEDFPRPRGRALHQRFLLSRKQGYRIHTSWLRSWRKTDSVIPLASGGVGHGIGVWAGAVWRPPPAKRGACLHEALVARPGSCIRRLGGTRSREMRFTRFLRNAAVTADEM